MVIFFYLYMASVAADMLLAGNFIPVSSSLYKVLYFYGLIISTLPPARWQALQLRARFCSSTDLSVFSGQKMELQQVFG